MKNLLTISLILFGLFVRAQTKDCVDLAKENQYLRSALNIQKTVKTAQAENIDFNLIKAEGNKNSDKIILQFVLTNKGTDKELQFAGASAIDVEGNEIKAGNINIGSSGIRGKLFSNTPVKTTIELKTTPTTLILKLINIEYYDPDAPGRTLNLKLKDIDVKWK